MLFLTECPLKSPAFKWAQEMSRMRASMTAVVALFDAQEVCVYVGAFENAPFAVAALAQKHGQDVITSVRYEEFPADALENPEGLRLMRGLAARWLDEAEATLGVPLVGNSHPDWDDFDTSLNPFAAGYIGNYEEDSSSVESVEDQQEARRQLKRESLKQRLDEAITMGNEAAAAALLSRISKLDDGAEDDEDDTFDPLSVF